MNDIFNKAQLSLEMERHGTEFPAWYRMRFVEPGTIVFLVQESVLEFFEIIRPTFFDNEKTIASEFDLPTFVSPNDSSWGYNNRIRTIPCDELGWVQYEIDLPASIIDDSVPIVSEVAGSIKLLVQALNGVRYDFVKEYPVPQLLTFQNFISKGGMGGAMMGAYYSRFIVEWTLEQGYENINDIALAMKKAFCHMIPKPNHDLQKEYYDNFYDNHEGPFSAANFIVKRDGDIYLDLAVNYQVSLYAIGEKKKKTDLDRGYKLDMRNPDSIVEQLNLIAGLAKLFEVVERWYRHQHNL